MAAPGMSGFRVRRVVSSFISTRPLPTARAGQPVSLHETAAEIFLFRRSDRVSTYQGRWAACSGSIDTDESPQEAALREVYEETGLRTSRIVRAGRPLRISSPEYKTVFVVHPFLVVAGENARLQTDEVGHQAAASRPAMSESQLELQLDWEHTEVRKADQELLISLEESGETVPGLGAAFARVNKLLRPRETGDALDHIYANTSDGSSVLANCALRGLKALSRQSDMEARNFFVYVLDVAYSFANARPSMRTIAVSVARVIERWLKQVAVVSRHTSDVTSADGMILEPEFMTAQLREAVTIGELANALEEEADAELLRQEAASCSINRMFQDELNIETKGQHSSVLTFSRSSTVTQALMNLAPSSTLVVSESSPQREGIAVARDVSASASCRVVVCPDSAMHAACRAYGINAIVVGADALLDMKGSDSNTHQQFLVNKTGTALANLLSQNMSIPLFILTDSTKIGILPYANLRRFAERLEHGSTLPVESDATWSCFNPVFEVVAVGDTRYRLITEAGLLDGAKIRSLAEANDTAVSLLSVDD